MKSDHRSIVDADGVEFLRVDRDQLTDALADEMIALFRSTFGQWPVVDPGVALRDHLHWKCSGPFTRIASMQARVDGRLAYATTSLATWIRVGGKRFLRVVFFDAAVDPAFQGRRIYTRAVAHRRSLVNERHDLSLHERGSSVRLRKPLGRKGQSPVGNKVTRHYRILRPLPFAAERGRLELSPLVIAWAALGAVTVAGRRAALRRSSLRPQDDGRFDARFETLFEEAAADFDVIGERSPEYLRWRYGDRRAGPFIVRTIAEDERLLGYAILRTAGAKAFVADVLAVPGRLDVVESLLADAVALARRSGAAGIECWLSKGHPYRAALRRQGLFDSHIDVGVQFHPIEASADDLRCLGDPRARVHFQMGDTDLI
jgi:hypothetical protein